MKLIMSIIRPEKLPDVKQSLWDERIHMMTIIDVRGCGQQKGFKEEYRGVIEEVSLHRKVMVLIAVNESFVDRTVKAVVRGARTNGGMIGDGKIFILPLEDCIRMSDGAAGLSAIGGPSKELEELKQKDGIRKIDI